jgi:hypothetical protein
LVKGKLQKFGAEVYANIVESQAFFVAATAKSLDMPQFDNKMIYYLTTFEH